MATSASSRPIWYQPVPSDEFSNVEYPSWHTAGDNDTATSSSNRDATRPDGDLKSKGPRKVTAMSAEQLVRKRAADRVAQRALRQRTRERIERLEERLRELSDNDTYGDTALAAAERRTLELEAEVRKLNTVLEQKTKTAELINTSKAGIGVEVAPASISMSTSTSTPPPVVSKSATLMPHPQDSPLVVVRRSKDVSSPPPLTPTPVQQLQPKQNPNPNLQRNLMRQPTVHIWELPLNLKKPTTPIENVLYGLVDQQRALATKGALTGKQLAGCRWPNLSTLIQPERGRPVHNVARIIAELLNRITYRTMVDKLGAFMIMYPIYQWLIMRSYESYCNLPSFMRPVLSQRMDPPHPVWVSTMGHAGLRDAMINNQERYATEEFQFLFVASLNINWPHGIEAALTWKDGDVTFSKAFWDHGRVLENWTVDEPFQSRYPELRGLMGFTKYPKKEGGGAL